MSNSIVSPTTPVGAPVFTRNRHGAILPTLSNVVEAVRRPDLCGWHVAYDGRDRTVVVRHPASKDWETLSPLHITHMRVALERLGFKSAPKGKCRDAVSLVAQDNKVFGVLYQACK